MFYAIFECLKIIYLDNSRQITVKRCKFGGAFRKSDQKVLHARLLVSLDMVWCCTALSRPPRRPPLTGKNWQLSAAPAADKLKSVLGCRGGSRYDHRCERGGGACTRGGARARDEQPASFSPLIYTIETYSGLMVRKWFGCHINSFNIS